MKVTELKRVNILQRDRESKWPPIKITEGANSSSNWITLLVGKNGSRKSYLLRSILDGALGRSSIIAGRPCKYELVTSGKAPSKVIALSTTPFDRFPRKSLYSWVGGTPSLAENDRYIYLGPKAPNGSLSTMHGMKTLAALLFGAANNKVCFDGILAPFEFLNLAPKITVSLSRNSALNWSRSDVQVVATRKVGKIGGVPYRRYRKSTSLALEASPNGETYAALAELFTQENDRMMLDRLSEFPKEFAFSFENGSIKLTHDSNFDRNQLAALLKVGTLTPTAVNVYYSEDVGQKKVSVEAGLSSGQWSLLSTLMPLALTAENNSLILIDEPENSMHPQWQRSYITLVRETLRGNSGCHVLLATHSPLVAGGVSDIDGNVIKVFSSALPNVGIETESVSTAFGWDANDVLDKVFDTPSGRDASFVAFADEALVLFSKGKANTSRFRELANKLEYALPRLPENDAMRIIIKSLLTSSK